MTIQSMIQDLIFPTWIGLTLAYCIYIMIYSGKFVKWTKFTVISIIEAVITVLAWGLYGIIGVAILILPLWIYMAVQVHKFKKTAAA